MKLKTNKVKRFFLLTRKTIGILGLLLFCYYLFSFSYNYVTYKKAGVSISPDDSLYCHPDKETTDILNYLGGINMSDSDKVDVVKKCIKTDSTNFSEMLSSGLYVLPNVQYQRSHYQSVWELHAKYGSPKLRWGKSDDFLGSSLQSTGGLYYGDEHTIYMIPLIIENGEIWFTSDLFDLYLKELSHSEQKYCRPVETAVKECYSFLILLLSFFDYKKQYTTYGTVEYEAHNVIEPELRREFKKIKTKKILLGS